MFVEIMAAGLTSTDFQVSVKELLLLTLLIGL